MMSIQIYTYMYTNVWISWVWVDSNAPNSCTYCTYCMYCAQRVVPNTYCVHCVRTCEETWYASQVIYTYTYIIYTYIYIYFPGICVFTYVCIPCTQHSMPGFWLNMAVAQVWAIRCMLSNGLRAPNIDHTPSIPYNAILTHVPVYKR